MLKDLSRTLSFTELEVTVLGRGRHFKSYSHSVLGLHHTNDILIRSVQFQNLSKIFLFFKIVKQNMSYVLLA